MVKKTWNFRQGCHNCIMHVQTNTLEKSILLKKFIFIVFFELWAETFRTLSKYFWQSHQNCILRVHRNILGSVKKNMNMLTPNWQMAYSGEKINQQRERFSFRNIVRRKKNNKNNILNPLIFESSNLSTFSLMGWQLYNHFTLNTPNESWVSINQNYLSQKLIILQNIETFSTWYLDKWYQAMTQISWQLISNWQHKSAK